jgi:hypothetical protein
VYGRRIPAPQLARAKSGRQPEPTAETVILSEAKDLNRSPVSQLREGTRQGRFGKPLAERTGGTEILFHAGPALARGFFGSAGAAPVRFQAHGVSVAAAL